MIDAAARGASDGLHLALNIGAMLIAFIGLIAMLNGGIHWLHATRYFGWLPDTMQGILGRIFAPIAWLLGVKWNDCATVGNLLGTRLILNEFVAFVDLGKIGRYARSQVLRDRDVRAVRLRQSELGGHPGGRHRSAGAVEKIGSGAVGYEGSRGRDHGQFHVGVHRGDAVMSVGVNFGKRAGRVCRRDRESEEKPCSDIPAGPYRRRVGTRANW